MQFRIPKYLERESTIAWGFTFKDLAVGGIIALLLTGLYYILGEKGRVLFFIIAFTTAALFVFFNFVKIRGQSVFEIAVNAVNFIFSNKVYVWEKKEGWTPIKLVHKKQEIKQKKEEPLRIAPRSRLGLIKSRIDITEAVGEQEFFTELGEGSKEEDEAAVQQEYQRILEKIAEREE